MTPYPLRLQQTLPELIQSQPQELLQHSQAVARLVTDLASAAGCPASEQQHIRLGGLLHDIGKQFVPASLLEKRGQLSASEFCRIQGHPWLGYTYLNNFVSDPIILNAVLYHHERWNGSGYPFGLQGEEIPLSARICALADVWDALVSDRCYRSAWSLRSAAELIWAGAGSLFDPQLAVQFLTLIEEHYRHAENTLGNDVPTLPISGRMVPVPKRAALFGPGGRATTA